MDIILKKGVPPESMCPGSWYVNVNADIPCNDQKTLDAAYQNRIKSYAAIFTVEDIKQAVFQDGIVVIGVPVTNAWVTGAATINGHIPYQPGAGIIGYHMIAIIGWDDDTGELEFRNSWWTVPLVTPWGDDGNGWMLYAYWDGYSASGDTEGYSAVDIIGPVPPIPPTPWERFIACVKAKWQNYDIIGMIGCLQELWSTADKLGYSIKVKNRKDGAVVITIRKRN